MGRNSFWLVRFWQIAHLLAFALASSMFTWVNSWSKRKRKCKRMETFLFPCACACVCFTSVHTYLRLRLRLLYTCEPGLTDQVGKELVRFLEIDITSPSLTFDEEANLRWSAKSVNFRNSSHTEGDRCQHTLNFHFLWTASKCLPHFDNSILKRVKTCHRETVWGGQTYDLVLCGY